MRPAAKKQKIEQIRSLGEPGDLKKGRKFNALDRDCDLFWKAAFYCAAAARLGSKRYLQCLFIAGMIPSSTVVSGIGRDGKRKGEAVSSRTLEHQGVWIRGASGWSESAFLAEFDECLVPNAPIQPLPA